MSSKPHPIKQSITVRDLATRLELDFAGDGETQIDSLSSLASADQGSLCFIHSRKFIEKLRNSECSAVIVPTAFAEPLHGKTYIFARNPHLAFVRAIELLQPLSRHPDVLGIDPSAQIDPSVRMGDNVSIAANCFIDAGVSIGNNVQIGAGCVVEQNVTIGDNSRLMARVTLCHRVNIGQDVIIHPGVVIGSDGFGLVHDGNNWVKIPQIGTVQIGDQVEIGANTTIDRGALDDTVIETGVKLDNLIQVAHNVHIGEHTAIAGCVGIAGSTIIGKHCKISGGVGITGHLTITDNVTITAMSMVTKSIHKSGTYSSGTPLMENGLWHRSNARYKSLDKLARTVSDLNKKTKIDLI